MVLNFIYNRERDINCLLTKGKASNNSSKATKAYELLVQSKGENATEEEAGDFIDGYIAENNIDMSKVAAEYQEYWSVISEEYQRRAEQIFGTSLPNNVTGYLTINNRCPYSIEDNLFYIAVPTTSSKRTMMHELWHFYTWYGLGATEESKLGKERYNDLKEALTVLLNVECKNLLEEGLEDKGYPQHVQLREEILKYWENERDIKKLWAHFSGA